MGPSWPGILRRMMNSGIKLRRMMNSGNSFFLIFVCFAGKLWAVKGEIPLAIEGRGTAETSKTLQLDREDEVLWLSPPWALLAWPPGRTS